MYSTVTKVREHAGFVGNTNIADSRIANYIMRAENLINSYISQVYTLPLPIFWQNTVTFSGTGSGTGTMTITVNGVNYVVAVTSGLTAANAADAFRRAVFSASGATFLCDNIGTGAAVTITSVNQEEDTADVTPTSTDPQTVAGITATFGTVTPTQIGFIEYLATETATAYLFISEYGAETESADKNGPEKLAVVRQDLKAIQAKEEKLFDLSGTELPLSENGRISFYPTEASRTDNDNPTANRATMNMKF